MYFRSDHSMIYLYLPLGFVAVEAQSTVKNQTKPNHFIPDHHVKI